MESEGRCVLALNGGPQDLLGATSCSQRGLQEELRHFAREVLEPRLEATFAELLQATELRIANRVQMLLETKGSVGHDANPNSEPGGMLNSAASHCVPLALVDVDETKGMRRVFVREHQHGTPPLWSNGSFDVGSQKDSGIAVKVSINEGPAESKNNDSRVTVQKVQSVQSARSTVKNGRGSGAASRQTALSRAGTASTFESLCMKPPAPQIPVNQPRRTRRSIEQEANILPSNSAGWIHQLRAWVHTLSFDCLASCLIISNTILIGVQSDQLAYHGAAGASSTSFRVLEIFFCVSFTAELAIRLWAYGCCRFFLGQEMGWNIFQAVLVIMQLFEESLMLAGMGGDSNQSNHVALFRFLRILRMARILRAVRVVVLIEELNLLVVSIVGSLRTICWTILLLLIVVYMLAVYYCQLVGEYLYAKREAGMDFETPMESSHAWRLHYYFGDLSKCILTLYQVVSGGIDWDNVMRPMVVEISPFVGITLACYISLTVYALFNAVTGVFVEAAVVSADKSKQSQLYKLAGRLFSKADENGDGKITLEEFENQLDSKEMRQYFQTLEVDIGEAGTIFALIDHGGSGRLDAQQFVAGCLSLRGTAKAIQLASFLKDFHRVAMQSAKDMQSIQQSLGSLEEQVDSHAYAVPQDDEVHCKASVENCGRLQGGAFEVVGSQEEHQCPDIQTWIAAAHANDADIPSTTAHLTLEATKGITSPWAPTAPNIADKPALLLPPLDESDEQQDLGGVANGTAARL